MNFFTSVNIPQYSFSISHQQPVLLLGSCFAQNIGHQLLKNKFSTIVNPFGIIYNPISLAGAFKDVLENKIYTENDLFYFNDLWLSFHHHGDFSFPQKEDTLKKINQNIADAHLQLKKTKTIIFTFGSAWVYEHKERAEIVANCHKLPASHFNKRLLSVNEVINSFSALIKKHQDINFLFTVSPVRHIKDGLNENNVSKSVLHLAVHELANQFHNCFYFPAYEIVVDELRDYRFFNEDMVHPTPQAINYVWNKFSEAFFDKNTQELIQKIEKIQNASQHKPFNFESKQHQEFIQKQLSNIKELETLYPYLNFENERQQLRQNKK